jgi:MOSC domain-containing protein YiiM
MKLKSLNVGNTKQLEWKEKVFQTGIIKTPTDKKLFASSTNIEGDKQGNLKVHGGVDKAIYVYPFEHYGYWEKKFPELNFSDGMFGENLTTLGMNEFETFIGDKYTIGDILVEVSEPRFPCVTLAARFGTADIVKLFLHSYKSGFYLRVLKEGFIQAGDSIALREKSSDNFSVVDFVKLYVNRDDAELKRRALMNGSVSEKWKEKFRNY